MEGISYRSILGSLIYLSKRTRPGIATAVSMLEKYPGDPTPKDWNEMKHLIRYLRYEVRLKGSVDNGVL